MNRLHLGWMLLVSSACFAPNAALETGTDGSGATTGPGSTGVEPTTTTTTMATGSTGTSTSVPTSAGTDDPTALTTGFTSTGDETKGVSESGECPNDEVGCPCIDGACEAGLSCVEGVCVETPPGMVFIPGGSFVNGEGPSGNNPQEEREVVDLFFDETEVTVQAYEECVTDGACEVPSASQCLEVGQVPGDPDPAGSSNYGAAGRALHPVNCIVYEEAVAFCSWASKRLPTEWEWEWAARGRDAGNLYPWGDMPAPTCEYCVGNFGGQPGCGTGEPASVGSRSPAGDTVDGLQDMAGNVYEWTSSADMSGTARQSRGGGFVSEGMRVDARDFSTTTNRYDFVGFRCVVEP